MDMYTDVLSIAVESLKNPTHLSFDYRVLTPVDHEYRGLSAMLWNSVYYELGMVDHGAVMLIGDPDNAENIYEMFRNDSKYIGGGSGSGFKGKAVDYMDELDPHARAMHAVNHIVKRDGKLIGYNTDGLGFVAGLEPLVEEKGKILKSSKVVILGAGSTSDAVAFALAERGANLSILNRTMEKAENVARRVNEFVGAERAYAGGEDAISQEVTDADIIVNVSKKGTGALREYAAFASVVPDEPDAVEQNHDASREVLASVSSDTIVSDVLLEDGETPTLRLAREAGLTTQDGLPMNINQAVEAFWLLHADTCKNHNTTKGDVYEIMARTMLENT